MTSQFIDFTGEETEKEFLGKLLLQWEKTNDCKSNIQKLCLVGSMMSEVRHRIRELENK